MPRFDEIIQPDFKATRTGCALPKTTAPSTSHILDPEALVRSVDALAIISATDVKGTIVYVNDLFCRISGYSQAELIGQNHRILKSGHHPAAFFKKMWQTIARGQIWRGEVKNRAKDGSAYWVDAAIAPVMDDRGKPQGYVSVRLDITRRKLAEEQLLAQKVQLDTALNNTMLGLSMFDAQARLIVCNELYRKIYGLPEELTTPGISLFEIIRYHWKKETGRDTPEDVEKARRWVENHIAQLALGKSFSYEQRLKSGRIVRVSNQPLPNGGWVDLQEDITEKRQLEAQITYMAHHDALTGLPNRVLLDKQLDEGLARVRRGERLAFYLLDLDDFKAVNDTLGHPIGDALLKAVAQRLRGIARETDTVARMGGDEFAVIQVGTVTDNTVISFARRLIEVVNEPYDIDGHHILVGASIGIALAPTDGDTADQLVRNSDLALYRAKELGRGRFCFFEKGLSERILAREALGADLRKALISGEMELNYQPIVNLADYQMTGVEALMRWHHPARGLIPPGEFIPLAEETGLIVPLGEWAIRRACDQAMAWPDRIKIAVNLSPLQLKQPGLVKVIASALAASALPPSRLEVEITESIFLEDTEVNLATLRQLRELGIRIVLDDFGTGYSSLRYLQSFPFNKIKIDQSFIRNVAVNSDTLKIVRAIVMLAHSLGITTTAEGVETKEQLDIVRFEGCEEIQGYFISRPVSAGEIERLYLPRATVKRATEA